MDNSLDNKSFSKNRILDNNSSSDSNLLDNNSSSEVNLFNKNDSSCTNKNDYLTKIVCDCLKGYFALFIIIHHVYQFTGIFVGTKLEKIFAHLGYWSVAVFIFITGYGLYESYKNKGDEYIKGFVLSRIVPFYCTYCIYAVLYIIYDLCFGIKHSLSEYIKTFTHGSTIISFGWYLQLSLLIYIVFYLIFRLIKMSKIRSLFLLVFVVAYLFFYYLNGMAVNLYTPLVFFLFGIICSRYKEFFKKVLDKLHILIFILSVVILVLTYRTINWYEYLMPDYIVPIAYIIFGMSFLMFVITVVRFVVKYAGFLIVNPISKFLGMISLEIYVFQGMFFRGFYLLSLNKYLYIALVVTCCVVTATVFNRLSFVLKKKIYAK